MKSRADLPVLFKAIREITYMLGPMNEKERILDLHKKKMHHFDVFEVFLLTSEEQRDID